MNEHGNGTPLPLESLRELLDDDEEAIREVLARFLETLIEARAGVADAIAMRNRAGLAFQIHRFKSAAGQIGAADCSRLCAVVYGMIRDESAVVSGDVEALAGQLVAAMDRLQRDMDVTLATLTR